MCEKIRGKIILPHKITTIQDNAFEGCRQIHSIEISKKLNFIAHSAFEKTYNFTRFVGSSTDYYTIHYGVLYNKDMSILLYCPKGYNGIYVAHQFIKTINNYAFDNCTQIEHIVMNHVHEIKKYAFNGCTKLKKVTLGKEYNYFDRSIFNGCQNLKEISIRNGNVNYRSVDGILYSADMKTLIFCPRGKIGVIKIPKTVEHIADYAFEGCNQLTKIKFSKRIKTIAFTGAYGGKLKKLCDECICVPEMETYKVQELHLPIYHCLCAMLEEEFF
jgi:hypothetical protein